MIKPSSASFQRPRRPSERFRVSLEKSSTKPIAAQLSVTRKTSTAFVVYPVRARNGIAIATTISTPPIVGVPCFVMWWLGPSSRICWPYSRWRR